MIIAISVYIYMSHNPAWDLAVKPLQCDMIFKYLETSKHSD